MHRFLVSNGSARTRRTGPAARRRAAVMVGMLAAALAAAVLPAVPAAAATVTVVATIPGFFTPAGVGVDPATNTIYVTNFGTGTVSVIDGASDTVVGSPIPVGSASSSSAAVGVDTATDTIYVVNSRDGNVSVIDGVTNTVTGTPITVGTDPQGVAVDSVTDRIYVANEGPGADPNPSTVSVINGLTNTVTATITVGKAPFGVAVDPATDTVYVANTTDDTVSVIDGATNTVTATIPGFSTPSAVAVDPATDAIYVTNFDTGTVSVIDGATDTVTDTVTVGTDPQAVAVDPITDAIYVANQGASTNNPSTVSVIDGATNTVTATVGVGQDPGAVGVDPATHDAYVANGDSNTVSVIHSDSDLAIAPPANVTTDATGPSGATVSYPAPVVTDPDDTHPPHASCSPASGTVFPIGTTTVHCSATDTDDIPSTVKTSFTVTVKGAAAQLADLAKAVQGFGTGNALTQLVVTAQRQLAAGHTQQVCVTLQVFMLVVDTKFPFAFSGNAATLSADAARIRAVLGCRSGLF